MSADDPGSPTARTTSFASLFVGFFWVGLSGIGGAIPYVRRLIVDERKWLGAQDFLDALSLCQFLPGPNVVNLAVYIGERRRGVLGALVALAGLALGPVAIVVALTTLYSSYGQTGIVRGAFRGVAAAAPGLIIGLGLQMALEHRDRLATALLGGAIFATVGVLRWPMIEVLLVMAPLSIAAAWMRMPRP